jgi:hypothetical protein
MACGPSKTLEEFRFPSMHAGANLGHPESSALAEFPKLQRMSFSVFDFSVVGNAGG